MIFQSRVRVLDGVLECGAKARATNCIFILCRFGGLKACQAFSASSHGVYFADHMSRHTVTMSRNLQDRREQKP